MRSANKTFQTKNSQALSIHLYLTSQGLQLNDQEKIAQSKSYKNAYNYKQYKVAWRVARNSQWGAVWGGLGAEPPALENFAFFSTIT